jgi:hypothetical protein
MKKLFLTTCLWAVGVQGVIAGDATLTVVKGTKYNVVNAIFTGDCKGLDPRKVKSIIKESGGKISDQTTTRASYLESLAPAVSQLRNKDNVPASCTFQAFAVLGRFPSEKTVSTEMELKDFLDTPTNLPEGPVSVVSYKAPTFWVPEITTRSLVGVNTDPVLWQGDLKGDTYLTMSTKKAGLLFSTDGGLEIKKVDKAEADATIAKQPPVSMIKFETTTGRLRNGSATAAGYAAGAADYAAGATIKVVAVTGAYAVAIPAVAVGKVAEVIAHETSGRTKGAATNAASALHTAGYAVGGAGLKVARGPTKVTDMLSSVRRKGERSSSASSSSSAEISLEPSAPAENPA